MTKRRLASGLFLVAVAVATSLATSRLVRARAPKACTTCQTKQDDDVTIKGVKGRPQQPRRETMTKPNVGFRDLVIVQDPIPGAINFYADVVAWRGGKLRTTRDLMRLRVEVFAPRMDAAAPKGTKPYMVKYTKTVVLPADQLYEERVPITIPVPPSDKVYPVMVHVEAWSKDGKTKPVDMATRFALCHVD